jgi:hypothetical protein
MKVPGPDEPVGGAAADDGTNDEEVTTFAEDVEEEDGTAPTSETLPDDERNAIEELVREIEMSNRDRGPDEQISVSPLEVN